MTAQQLKESILQMAVQGKLIPQDPNDEPASVLIQKIRDEKEQMIKDGKIKKEKNSSFIFRGDDGLFYEKVGNKEPVCIEDEVPFEIPDSWEWVRFNNLVYYIIGKTPPRKETEYWEPPKYSWVSIADMNADGTVTTTKEQVSQLAFDYTFKGNLSPAETLLMSFKLTVGKVSILKIPAFHNEAIISIYPIVDEDNTLRDYLFYTMPLLSQLGETKSAIKGNTLNSKSLDALLVPVPPLNEQKRIIKLIKKILPSIEKYNNTEIDLSILEKEFPIRLKKSILQMAVQGKLVPQDPNDEPASILIERIHDEKVQLIRDGKIKRDKHESFIYKRDGSFYEITDGKERCINGEIPFEIPDSWEWARMGTVVSISSGNGLTSNKMDETGPYPVYGGNGIMGYYTSFNVNRPTLVIGRVGYYCGSTHITPEKAWVTDNAFITRFNENNIYMQWLKLFIDSLELRNRASSTAQPVVSGKLIYPILMPVPPLAEQKRIVAKINPLFADIDTLKKCITDD